ncbi:MAG: SDR family oxidoreductase [Salinisphaeraceae bacterium]|nr:SDR family oxidoreductase [Salinisphaeraceae bacterium]
MAKLQSLQGKVVIITGAARGIGLATAKAFATQGARVSIGDVDAELAAQQAKAIDGYGGAIDVRDPASVRAFIKATETALGPVDVLVNNAGIMPTGDFTDESDAISDTQIDINIRGVIHGCKAVLPGMLQRGGGHIVNVASMAGVLPVPGLAVYCATKFAVVGLTKTLREEYRDTGVSFSTIMPSKVTTELAAGTDSAAKGVPTVSPAQVADAVVAAVQYGHAEVTVPGYLGAAPALLGTTPYRLQRGFRKLFGDRRVLEALDQDARAGYNARINQLAQK